MITKEQEAALHELVCNTHVLWTPEHAKEMTKHFGFECRVSFHVARPSDPKGLTLNGNQVSAEGASSWEISGQIAAHVGAKPEGKWGRGSQVRSDCDAIRNKLNGG